MAVRVTKTLADYLNSQVFNVNFVKIGLFYNGTEITGTGYARATGSTFAYNTEDSNYYYYTNTSIITFPTAGSNWGSVNQIGFFDASNNLLCLCDLPFTIVVNQGNTVSFIPNTLILQIPKIMS